MFSIFLLQFKADISRRGFLCLSVATVTTLTSTGTDLNESGHRPPLHKKKYETLALFFGRGFGFFHSRSFYNGNPENLGRAPQKKGLCACRHARWHVCHKKPVFCLPVVAAVGVSVWLEKCQKKHPSLVVWKSCKIWALKLPDACQSWQKKNTHCLRVMSFALFVLFWRKNETTGQKLFVSK